jgi:hypothetical protein
MILEKNESSMGAITNSLPNRQYIHLNQMVRNSEGGISDPLES